MLKKLSLFSIIATIWLISAITTCFSVGTETINGLNLTYIEDGVLVERWTSYSVGTTGTYVYNNSGSTTATAGSIQVQNYDYKLMGMRVTNTDAATVTARLEFQIGTTTYWVLPGVEIVVSGTGTADCPISEYPTNLRWGIIKTGTTSADVSMFEVYKRHSRR